MTTIITTKNVESAQALTMDKLSVEPKFVNRARELELLKSYLMRAIEGHGSCIFIQGERGIGKSRLVRELAAIAKTFGVRVIESKAVHSLPTPYYVFATCLKSYTATFTDTEHLPFCLLPTAKLLPETEAAGGGEQRELLENIDFSRERYRLHESVLRFITTLAQRHPLLLIIEDMQWADPASLALLHYIAMNIASLRIMMCYTYNPDELIALNGKPHELQNLLREMNIERLYSSLKLTGFSFDAVATMIREFTADYGIVPSKLIQTVYKLSDGNPLFIEEMLKSIMSQAERKVGSDGKIYIDWDSVLTTFTIPQTVRDVLKMRLAQLDTRSERLLQYAATIGTKIPYPLLEKVVDLSDDEILDALDTVIKLGILHEVTDDIDKGEFYQFTHSLMREVIYDELTTPRRRIIHRKIAETLEQLYADNIDEVVFELTKHFESAQVYEKTLEYTLKSAELSARLYAMDTALKFARKALGYLEKVKQLDKIVAKKVAMLEIIGDVLFISGEYDDAYTIYTEALNHAVNWKLDVEAARLNRKLGNVHEKRGAYQDALQYYYKALGALKDADKVEASRIYSVMIWICNRLGDYDKALEWYQRGIAALKTYPMEKHILAELHSNIGAVYWRKGDYVQALEYHNKALELRKVINDLKGIARSYANLGMVYWDMGMYDNAIKYHELGIEICDKIGDVYGVTSVHLFIGLVKVAEGKLDDAEEYYNKSLTQARRIGNSSGEAAALLCSGELWLERNAPAKAIDWFERSIRICKSIGDKGLLCINYNRLAEALIRTGKIADAKAYCINALSLAQEIGSKDDEGIGYRLLAMINYLTENLTQAEDYFNSSIKQLHNINNRRELGKTYYEFGLLLKLKGDIKRATHTLERALQIFKSIHAHRWVKVVETELESIA
jgi:predicted ATPase